MTQRERYLHFFVEKQDPENLPLWGDWFSVYDVWIPQGLPPVPEGTDIRKHMCDLFGFEGIYSAFWGVGRLPVNTGVVGGFPIRELELTKDYRRYVNSSGVTILEKSHYEDSMIAQQYQDHFLKGAAQWEAFKKACLDPNAPGRYPPEEEWRAIVEKCRDRDTVVTIDGGSFYGYLRDWMGVEGLSYAMFDEPEWVQQAAEELADLYITVLERAVTEVPDVDVCLFWEDMCFKNGPMCSPEMFRKFFLHPYQRVTDFLKKHGVKTFWVDCDGNIEKLIDLFMEGGVNGFYPLEVAAGMDAVALKKRYGNKILLWGNIDKREIAKGKEAIERELERVAPAVEMGGFIPLVDHGVPDDVSFENYRLYDSLRKERFKLKAIPAKK